MTKKRFSILLAILLGAALVLSSVASLRAQEDGLAVKDMEVSFWPEYDADGVLVMYQGEFAGAWDAPQEVRFSVPKGSTIGQVCALDQGQHLCQLYTTQESGDDTIITYTLPKPTFYLEVYAPLSLAETARDFSYDFATDYPIERLAMNVQQPLRSVNFRLSPSGGDVSSDNRGFKYYTLEKTGLAAGDTVPLNVTYTKQDRSPSLSSAGGGLGGGWTVLLVVLILAVLGAGFWFFFIRRPRVAAPQYGAARSVRRQQARAAAGRVGPPPPASRGPAPRAPRAAQPPVAPRRGGGPARFCTSCGQELDSGHRFCPSCGEKTAGQG